MRTQKLIEAGIGISENRVEAVKGLVKDQLPSDLVNSLERLASEEFATPAIKSKSSQFNVKSMVINLLSAQKRKKMGIVLSFNIHSL